MANLAFERLDAVCGYAKLLGGQLVKHRHRAGHAHAPLLPQIGYFAFTFLAIQIMDAEPLRSSSFLTKRLPMKPVAPGTKYRM